MSVTGRRRGGGTDPPVALMGKKDVRDHSEPHMSRFNSGKYRPLSWC